jgi:hypothetical protein
MARSVNKVWNLCKEKQVKALEERVHPRIDVLTIWPNY